MEDEMGGAYSAHGELRNSYILIGKFQRRRPFGKPRYNTWKDNIKMDLREIGWKDVD
jgi:hypothetical protein